MFLRNSTPMSLRCLASLQKLLALLILAASPLGALAADDGDFLNAKAAFDRSDRAKLEQIAPRLAGHPLQAYVDYWRLKLAIDVAADEDVRAFLQRYPGSVLADKLRVDWLKSLGKRGQWATFGTELANTTSEDVELACFGVQYRRQQEGDAALITARPLWFTGSTSPDACQPLFDALIASNQITVADRRTRFRLAAQAGNLRLAEVIGADLPATERVASRELMQIEREPARALAKGQFRWNERSGHELALFALERAARTDAAGVRGAWEKQRGHLASADRLYGNVRIAYHAARQLAPQAAEWFRETQGATLTDAEHVWHVRAALRAGAWRDVLAAIEAMPPTLAEDPAWRYWKARALVATGRDTEATPIYTALARDHHYYALLAAEALGKGAEILPAKSTTQPAVVAAEALQQFGARSDVRRAVKLAELDLRNESRLEWYYAVKNLDDDALLVAAEYARRLNLYDRAINTAERTSLRHDFRLRYLTPFREHFAAAAREQSLDPALLFGLARQESRFNANIVSSAGAIGLMQLMPATARWIAKQMGKTDYRSGDIADIATNTQFGAFYFRYCLERLDGQAALAAAAYNAGPGRAQAWRGNVPLEGAIWVETIPFNETRDYVKKVLANAVFYGRELDQPYVALSIRLGTIQPKGLSSNSLASAGR